ncbi:MAG: hypothetical protein A2Y73_08455 [Chloroflexi bacterium RBG_13_56_8]|nr:MAG: hypothetical protein A2Y73_08455 [Chloroflexi bacterium RBG_13_56_8]
MADSPSPANERRRTAHLALRGAFYVAISDYALQALGIILGIILTRILAAEDFGILAFAQALMSSVSLLTSFSLNEQLTSEREPSSTMISTHWLLSSGLALASLLLVAAATPLLLRIYQPVTVQVLLALLFFWLLDSRGIGATPETLLRKELRYGALSWVSLASSIVSSALALLCAWAGWGVWALVVRQGTRVVIRSASLWMLSEWRPTFKIDWKVMKTFLVNGSHLWLYAAGMLVTLQYDDFLVGQLRGNEALGYYERAYHYAELPMSVLSAAYAVIIPTFAKVASDRAALSKAYGIFLDSVALVCFPAAVAAAVIAPEFTQVVLGAKWAPIAPLLRILLPFALIRPIMNGSATLPIVTKQPKVLSRLAGYQILSMLLLCTPMTYFWGVTGAGISADMVQLVALGLLYRSYLSKSLSLSPLSRLVWPLVASGVGAGIALAIQVALHASSLILLLIVKTAAFGMVYVGILWLFRRHELREQARYLRERFLAQ